MAKDFIEDVPANAARPGAVKHDSRGNAVWQWAVATGKHALDSTSALLRRLDMPGLALQGDAPKRATQEPQLEAQRRHGYDPYARTRKPVAVRSGVRTRSASDTPTSQGAGAALSPPAPAPAPRRSSWWSRLFDRR